MQEFVEKNAKMRRRFFSDAREAVGTLSTLHVKSARLRQLGWLLQSILDDPEPGGTGEWIRKMEGYDGLLAHEDLMAQIEGQNERSVKRARRIELFIEAFSEMMMYVELAQHANARGWTSFPEILDPKEAGRPILSIVDGHSPRALENAAEGKGKSVPNSIRLGEDSKRHAIITGPNAQGKSTVLRMVGQLVTLAQLGLPVPAQSMRLTPLGLLVYLHPKDNPVQGDSLFMAEARELWHGVHRRAAKDPFQLVIMDEIAPGTIQQVREDFETVVLQALDHTGVLSLTATHNLGTTRLGEAAESPFVNLHAADYRLLKGGSSDLRPMYDGAAKALRGVGLPEEVVGRFLELGRARQAAIP